MGVQNLRLMSDNIYETPKLLHEYLLFHYGMDEEVLPWPGGPIEALRFPVRSVQQLIDVTSLSANGRALDLGCAVGRSAFELADRGLEVIGIDFSQAFVDAAATLAREGRMAYRRHEEAGRFVDAMATLPENLPRESVRFEQGDAMNLRPDLGCFEVVHAANLLCRLPDPEACLKRLPSLVGEGGQLLLTTPCTWLEEFTPKEAWPENGSTRDWLHQHLSDQFTLEMEIDMPFLIREHARKFQWSVALGSRWRRRASGQ